MKCKIHKLDKRHSYHQLFDYYIGFDAWHGSSGPIDFVKAQKWFFDIYGWSAEISIHSAVTNRAGVMKQFPKLIPVDIQDLFNDQWSWSIAYNDLRIYVKSSKELGFFMLAHQVDQ